MNRSTKAALLSALVFPGAGHLFLRKTLPAVLLMAVTFTALYFLMSSALQQATQIVDKILSGEVQADVSTLIQLITNPKDESNTLSMASMALGISWVVGVFDAWRLGRSEQPESDDRLK